ncbi:MAG: AAA family ATPase [Vicinamibacterales bacterium]
MSTGTPMVEVRFGLDRLREGAVAAAGSVGERYQPPAPAMLPTEDLVDAVDVAREGRELDERGVPWLVDGLIPQLGMVGFLVAYAKVGKTSLVTALCAAIARGDQAFIERAVTCVRVLVIAAEDPPEYTAFLARHLDVSPGRMTFYRKPILLDDAGLSQIEGTVREGEYGLVYVSSWQAVIRGLVKDENDNMGAVAAVERVKQAARRSGVPWLIDAHSGKGESRADDADPVAALRGASSAAGAADYVLSLRYAGSPFGPRRRLSGKGRFVSVEPIVLTHDATDGSYTLIGTGASSANDIMWQRIEASGALSGGWASVSNIASAIGAVASGKRVSGGMRKAIMSALAKRPAVDVKTETVRGKSSAFYRLLEPTA